MKDIYQNNLDFSNPYDIEHFIEKHTNILDKSVYSKSIPVLASHLKNINTKIIQKINKIKIQSNIMESKYKLSNSYKKNSRIKKYQGTLDSKFSKYTLKNTTSKQYDNSLTNCLQQNNKKKYNAIACNLTDNIIEYVEYENELNKKLLELYTKDEDFIKKYIHISLYIATEKIDCSNFENTDKKYQQIILLCKQAILCLVEPSEKAYVLCTNNLSAIIQKHLSQGCRYHFESSSDSTEYYNALLVVSHWAKLLVKHQNITMIHMICAILGCEINKILILSYPEDMVNEEAVENNKKTQPVFKNPSFHQQFRPISNTGKKRTWRSLKQVLAQERSLPWPTEVVHYSAINAPPSFKPAKKYSDISGLPARYTDPQTKLYYATAEEFATVRSLPMDITAGYLALRGASSIVG
uniref:Vps72/YL1 C-terminal domain-containing protein n=1 Tax=Vespula pensylvanica TaxID=30213 RepID=A0A834NK17_VESPE|nr:hypothetical protein H0235_012876 [Vespula pensylvanica]